MLAVSEEHTAAQRVVRLEHVMRAGEMVDHREVERVELLWPIQPDQQHVSATLKRYRRFFVPCG
jgi:hypothetical protein